MLGLKAALLVLLVAGMLVAMPRQFGTALLVVDVQLCFMPGGSLPVPDGEAVVPMVSDLLTGQAGAWDLVAFSQDYHPPGHVSFASTFGRRPFEVEPVSYRADGLLCNHTDAIPTGTVECEPADAALTFRQALWPDHCVQGTPEAALHPALPFNESAHLLVQKGELRHVDGYSALFDNEHHNATHLVKDLAKAGVIRVYVAGLAYDYCVLWTALDAASLGYDVAVIGAATRGIAQATMDLATRRMVAAGVRVVSLQQAQQELQAGCTTAAAVQRHLGLPLPAGLQGPCRAAEAAWRRAKTRLAASLAAAPQAAEAAWRRAKARLAASLAAAPQAAAAQQ